MSLPVSVYSRVPRRLPFEMRYSECSLSFDNVNDYLEAAHSPTLSLTEATMMIWSRLRAIPTVTFSTPFFKTQNYGMRIQIGGRLEFPFFMGGGWRVFTSVNPVAVINKWQFLAISARAGETKLYVNGEEVPGIGTQGIGDSSINPLYIGCQFPGGHLMNGSLDEGQILNYFASASEIKEAFQRGYARVVPGCVLNLRMEENAGLTAYDDSGNSNHASLMPVASPPTWRLMDQHKLLAESEQ